MLGTFFFAGLLAHIPFIVPISGIIKLHNLEEELVAWTLNFHKKN